MASQPLTPPVNEPDAEPTTPMLINDEWVTYLAGFIENVRYREYWDVSKEDWPNLEARIDRLIDIFQHPD